LITLFGAAGNLLTLLAIPWAQKNRRLGFDRGPAKYTIIFMLNLAAADLIYCITILPIHSITVSYCFKQSVWALFKYSKRKKMISSTGAAVTMCVLVKVLCYFPQGCFV
jgi:hypothetical protein